MATVYKAYDTRLERNVAVKVLRTEQFIPAQLQMVLQRFEREAKSLAKLSNPNIVNILDFGEHEGMPYLVMEYLPGGTLKKKLGSAIPWREAVQVLLPVARGLAYAHQHGIIHRDVKPANILMNESDRPILTDFGIAKLLEVGDGHTLTGSGVGIGTPEYMAPEQGIGASTIDERADVYSLGIVLYEMIAGRKPYIADTPMAVVLKQMTDPLPRPTDFVPDLPEHVEQILLKALAKEPENRYPDMNAMIDAMDSVLAETVKVEVPASIQKEIKKEKPGARISPRVIGAVIGAAAVILILVFGIPWAQKNKSIVPTATAKSTKAPVSIPTKTATPAPAVTAPGTPGTAEAAEALSKSVLAYFAVQSPTFEDDFSTIDDEWGETSEGLAISSLVDGGVLTVTDHAQKTAGTKPDHAISGTTFPLNGVLDARDFGLKFDFNFETGQAVNTVAVQFRSHEFTINDDGVWTLFEISGSKKNRIMGGNTELQPGQNTLLIVLYSGNMGVYLNDDLLHSADDMPLTGNGNRIIVSGDHGSSMEFDNVKFWDLDG
jgi:serine/threonine protein kinase